MEVKRGGEAPLKDVLPQHTPPTTTLHETLFTFLMLDQYYWSYYVVFHGRQCNIF